VQTIMGDGSPVDRRSLDEVLADWIENYKTRSSIGWFRRVTLPKSEADNLCWEIAHQGITQATLFPNLSGVVAAMNDRSRWDASKWARRRDIFVSTRAAGTMGAGVVGHPIVKDDQNRSNWG